MSKDVFEPGERCGAHEVIRRIAEGGHGQVYLARHVDGGFRAIKTLHAQFLDIPNVRQRFDNEILLLSAIDSVHVVRVYEYGLANGHPWFSMEYLDGQPLRRIVLDAGGRLDVERAFRFARQLARGAHAAHQLKAIHRDLKPENIVVMPGDVLKILDFGIAKIRGWAVPTTGRGEGFCTPLYAAPEQIDGSGRRADARTDVYAIGVITWEMLVGKNPFLDEEGNVPAMEITMSVKLTQPLRRLPEVLRGFPEELAAIIEKATAIDPDHRYASAAELSAAIKEPLKRWVAMARGDALPELPKEMAALTAAIRTGEPLSRPAARTVAAPEKSSAAASPPTTGWARTQPLSSSFVSSWQPSRSPVVAEREPPTTRAETTASQSTRANGPLSSVTPPAVTSSPSQAPVEPARRGGLRHTIAVSVLGAILGAGLCIVIVLPMLRGQGQSAVAQASPGPDPGPMQDAGSEADASAMQDAGPVTDPGPRDRDGGAADAGPTPHDGGATDAGSADGGAAKKPPNPARPAAPATPPKKKSDRPVMVF